MQSFEEVAAALRTHREAGRLRVAAIDDFGTGMSSLQYLLDLPADHLKIDRTFVAGVETDELSRQIVRLIIDLARRIDVEVIAEGVENTGAGRLVAAPGLPHGPGLAVRKGDEAAGAH